MSSLRRIHGALYYLVGALAIAGIFSVHLAAGRRRAPVTFEPRDMVPEHNGFVSGGGQVEDLDEPQMRWVACCWCRLSVLLLCVHCDSHVHATRERTVSLRTAPAQCAGSVSRRGETCVCFSL